MDRKIEVNVRSVVIAAAILCAAYVVWLLHGVLFLVAIAYLISAAVSPFAVLIHKRGVPRGLSIILVYLLVIAALIGAGVLMVPPLVSESVKFYTKFPDYFANVARGLQIDTSVLNQNLQSAGAEILKTMVSLVSNVIEFVTVFILSIYISFERINFKKYLITMFGEARGERIENIMTKMEQKLGLWVRGQFLLCFLIGLATYVGLTLLKFPYAVPLAVIGGILEIVPNIGPILSAAPAVVIGLSNSTFMGLTAVALYFIIHQSENYLVVPRVMGQAVGLSPLAIIIVLLVGGSLMGGIGVILAIPVFLMVQTIVEELGKK
jgi:predicted PurR-regulated permease PerM